MRDESEEKVKKRYERQKPALDFDSAGEYNIYINVGSRANGLSPILL